MCYQRHNFLLLFSALLILFLAGCASYSMRSVMTYPPEEYPSMSRDNALSIAVDPLDDRVSSESIFNTDLNRFGFLAVNVIIRNDGRHPFRIAGDMIKVINTEGFQLPFATAEAVAGEAGASILKWSIISGDLGELSAMEAREKMVQDMITKEFYDQTILPGTTVSGFLYLQHRVGRFGASGYRLVLAHSPSGQPLQVTIQ